MPFWLVILSWFSVILGFVTALGLAVDLARHPQQMAIMNIVWPITGFYFPLAGFWLYAATARTMEHEAAKHGAMKAPWKSVFLSATHCGAGCVIGDVIGAPFVFALGLTLFGKPLFADYAVEFGLAYILGIAFQYFPIRAARTITAARAIMDAIKADTLSLVAFEIGMFGWMAISHFALFPGHHPGPDTMAFWFMMQIGMVAGFVTTYPANWLLIKAGIKRGM